MSLLTLQEFSFFCSERVVRETDASAGHEQDHLSGYHDTPEAIHAHPGIARFIRRKTPGHIDRHDGPIIMRGGRTTRPPLVIQSPDKARPLARREGRPGAS